MTWSEIRRAGAGLLRGLRVVLCVVHLMSGSVAGSARLAFLRTRLLHLLTWRLARYALSKYGRCCSHDSSNRERDDLCLHDVLLRISPSMQRNEPSARSPERMFIMSAGFPPASAAGMGQRSARGMGRAHGSRPHWMKSKGITARQDQITAVLSGSANRVHRNETAEISAGR